MTASFHETFPTDNKVHATGRIRVRPEDFQVAEINDFEFSGQGEHLWLYVRKTGSNTDWVAKRLADVCQVPARQVGYAGLKDRHAVTSQWFSIQLPKVDAVDLLQADLPDEIEILESHRHHKKLKTGGLKANRFKITVRDIQGKREAIEQNLAAIKARGVPNYFGEQRFGHDMGNVDKAAAWFAGQFRPKNRSLKSLLISTARSWIFNHILAHRIQAQKWLTPLHGDIFQLDGSRSWFMPEGHDFNEQDIQHRLEEKDIHITAALWGEDDVQTQAEAAGLENSVAVRFPELTAGLTQHRVRQDRRSMRLRVDQLQFSWQRNDLVLIFELMPGGYATSVMREIFVAEK